MIWASNWPHVGVTEPQDDARLLDLLLHWTTDDATRFRILVDNPAALFGFGRIAVALTRSRPRGGLKPCFECV